MQARSGNFVPMKLVCVRYFRSFFGCGCGARRLLSSAGPLPRIEAVVLDLECVRARAGGASVATTDDFAPVRDTEWLFRRKNRGRGELQVNPQPRPTTGDKYAEAVRGRKLAATMRQSDASGLRSSGSTFGGGDSRAWLGERPSDKPALPPPLRAPPAAAEVAATEHGSNTAGLEAPLIWSVANGALELLKYLQMRRLRVGLLLTHPPEERFPLNQFLHQLGAVAGTNSGALGAIVDAEACAAAPAPAPVLVACAHLDVPPVNTMLLASSFPVPLPPDCFLCK